MKQLSDLIGFRAVYALIVLIVTLFLSEYTKDFWSGYKVEFAGILLEVAIIYLLVENLFQRKKNKQLIPVKNKLHERVVTLQMLMFESLEESIHQVLRKQNGDYYYRGDNIQTYDYDFLKQNQNIIIEHLSHSASFLPVELYTELMDYIDSSTEILRLIQFLQMVTRRVPPPVREDGSQDDLTNWFLIGTTSFQTSAIEESQKFYLKLKGQSGELTKPFFKSEPVVSSIENLAEADTLVTMLKNVKVVKLQHNN
ncbi:hypothetical protein F0261_03810 [Alteromonas sp. 07-89-2]|jgi:hypothetical protein|uniref:hypothetical protein n=1 Tax=Alteromonas sp. 07-89-2 TaxID=2607609 RepID=UPI00148B7062|nr:hypothetical protein [Alteromonas sp. 07-89-2]NOH57164.1 hypothetical protein [Alteromonas sp. 07-89-2]